MATKSAVSLSFLRYQPDDHCGRVVRQDLCRRCGPHPSADDVSVVLPPRPSWYRLSLKVLCGFLATIKTKKNIVSTKRTGTPLHVILLLLLSSPLVWWHDRTTTKTRHHFIIIVRCYDYILFAFPQKTLLLLLHCRLKNPLRQSTTSVVVKSPSSFHEKK